MVKRLALLIALGFSGVLVADAGKKALLSTTYSKSLVWPADPNSKSPQWSVQVVDFSSLVRTPLILKKLISHSSQNGLEKSGGENVNQSSNEPEKSPPTD